MHPRVHFVGRLTRDPEMRSLASGKSITTFSVATVETIAGSAVETTEYVAVVAWDRLAETTGRHLSKGNVVEVIGRLATRSWDDDNGTRHWRTEVTAEVVEIIANRAPKSPPVLVA